MTAHPRFRFRRPHWIGLLVVFVLLVMLGIGFSVWLPYRGEQEIVQRIESWKGRIETESGRPEWLGRLVSEDRLREYKVFDRVVSVSLERTAVADAELALLCGLTHLRTLTLDRTAVTDAGLAHLSGTSLKALSLCDTTVSDAGLAHLSGLTSLQILFLSGTAVTDTGLAHLRGMTKLRELSVDGTSVTETGVERIKNRMPGCHIVH